MLLLGVNAMLPFNDVLQQIIVVINVCAARPDTSAIFGRCTVVTASSSSADVHAVRSLSNFTRFHGFSNSGLMSVIIVKYNNNQRSLICTMNSRAFVGLHAHSTNEEERYTTVAGCC